MGKQDDERARRQAVADRQREELRKAIDERIERSLNNSFERALKALKGNH